MIGSGLKKLAKENEMTIANGFGYGDFHGYDTSFSEGAGYKLAIVYGYWSSPTGKDELQRKLEELDLMKQYRLQDCTLVDDGLVLNFFDNPGTMKKMRAFLEWLMPLLPEHGLLGRGYCPFCGQVLTGQEEWKLFNGVPAHAHAACMDSELRAMEQEEEAAWEEDRTDPNASVVTGAVGAVLGALLGSCLWIVVYAIGYVAAICGFVIGWLSRKGYDLFHGKRGKACVVIVVLATLLGVVVGQLGGQVLSIALLIHEGELPGLTYGDISYLLIELMQDAEYLGAVGRDLLLGLFMALLGMIGILADLWKTNTKSKFSVKDMKK